MHVDVFQSVGELERLRPGWEQLYRTDPDANYFMSWPYVRDWLNTLEYPWFVLAARESSSPCSCVGVLPLIYSVGTNSDGAVINCLVSYGIGAASYTGFLIDPEHEALVLASFARKLKSMNWALIQLERVRSPQPRREAFLQHFLNDGFEFLAEDEVNDDGVDNLVCPYIPLPGSFDQYLGSLSANMRQKLRRLFRKLESEPQITVRETTSETVDRDLRALQSMWSQKWGSRKGHLLHEHLKTIGYHVRRAHEGGTLFMPVMEFEGEPVGVLVLFHDSVKRELLFYIAGRREDWEGIPAGLILHAYSIRHAIELGCQGYDFLNGNEPYKFSFGAVERRLASFSIVTPDCRNLHGRLEPLTRASALRYAKELLDAKRFTDAEAVLENLLSEDGQNIEVLLMLARLRISKGDQQDLEELIDRAVEIAPEYWRVWLTRGCALEMLSRYSEALKSYRHAEKLVPHNPVIAYSIARVLRTIGEKDLALSYFRSAEERAPGLLDVAKQIRELEADRL